MSCPNKVKGSLEVGKNLNTRSIGIQILTTPTSITLDHGDPSVIEFNGTAMNQIINLGDATTYKLGQEYTIYNNGDNKLSIQNNSGTELLSIKKNNRVVIKLKDKSTSDGVWIYTVSSKTGASAALASGYQFVKAGSAGSGDYLYNNDIETNKVGLPTFADGEVVKAVITNEKNGPFTVRVYEQNLGGGGRIELFRLTVPSGQKGKIFEISDIQIINRLTVNADKELSARMRSGDAENIRVTIFINESL